MTGDVDRNLISPFSTAIWCGGSRPDVRMSSCAKVTECFWFIVSCTANKYRIATQLGDTHFSIERVEEEKNLNVHFGYKCLSIFISFLIIPPIILLATKIYFRRKNQFDLEVPSNANRTLHRETGQLPIPAFTFRLPSENFQERRIPGSDRLRFPLERAAPVFRGSVRIHTGVSTLEYDALLELFDLVKEPEPNLTRMDELLRSVEAELINSTGVQGSGTFLSLLAHAVVHRASLEVIKKLVEAGAKDVTGLRGDGGEWEITGISALSFAGQRNNLPILLYLLEQGADPLHPCIDGGYNYSSLLKMIQPGHLECVKYLFSYVTDPRKLANGGHYGEERHLQESPLEQAFKVDAADIFEYLLSQGANTPNCSDPTVVRNLFFRGAHEGKINIMKFFIRCGHSLNCQEETTGLTALHYAAANKCDELVKFLLEAGADPKVRNHQGETYEEYAAKQLNEKALLRIRRLAIGEGFHGKANPFTDCTLEETFPFVIDANAIIGNKEKKNTVLHLIMRSMLAPAYSIVPQLIERGADPAALNHMGETSFGLAKQDLGVRNIPEIQTVLNTITKIYEDVFKITAPLPTVLNSLIAEYLTG